jgi:hypothetical protein
MTKILNDILVEMMTLSKVFSSQKMKRAKENG